MQAGNIWAALSTCEGRTAADQEFKCNGICYYLRRQHGEILLVNCNNNLRQWCLWPMSLILLQVWLQSYFTTSILAGCGTHRSGWESHTVAETTKRHLNLPLTAQAWSAYDFRPMHALSWCHLHCKPFWLIYNLSSSQIVIFSTMQSLCRHCRLTWPMAFDKAVGIETRLFFVHKQCMHFTAFHCAERGEHCQQWQIRRRQWRGERRKSTRGLLACACQWRRRAIFNKNDISASLISINGLVIRTSLLELITSSHIVE